MSSATERTAPAILGLILLAASGCSSSPTDGTPDPSDASTTGSGGSTGSGGATGTGGGATGSGGATGTGGSSGTGTGGATSTGSGGANGTGGATGNGGSSGTAGSAGRGGSTESGGSTGSGGMRDASTDARPRDAAADVRRFDAAPECIAGDPQLPLELALVYRTTGNFMPVGTTPLQLVQPTQGGEVLFIGVRARNIAGCNVTINTALVDTSTAARPVVSLESRPIFLEMGNDGWLQPRQPTGMSNYSNLPACPRANLLRSIDDQTYELRVVLTDQQGRTGQTTMNVVPTCGGNTMCHCLCAQNYMLGMTCN